MHSTDPILDGRAGSPTDDEAERLPERIGSYRVLGRLGSGNSGIVFTAQRDGSPDVVALKVLRPGRRSEEVLRRFRREARLLRELRHPGIAAFLDAGEADLHHDGGRHRVPYLAMERVVGLPLRRFAREHELDPRERAELAARVCDAVDHAHSRGIVHRDLSPSNVLVHPSEDRIGQPKVLDFGLSFAHAGEASSAATSEDSPIGTLPYTSPEQAGGAGSVTARSDVYSLGVVLYELLTDRLPYDVRGRPLSEAARTIQSAAPPRWKRAGSLADLQIVVGQALEKDPARRYATAGELAADLRAASAGRPVRARAPGLARRLRAWTRRHRVLGGSMAVAFVGALAILGSFLRARRAFALALRNEVAADLGADEARRRLDEVQVQRADLLRLADRKRLDGLERRADELWPIHPDTVPALDLWLDEAGELVGRAASHASVARRLREEPGGAPDPTGRANAWWVDELRSLVEDLERFAEPGGTLARIRARRAAAATLAERTLVEPAAEWERVRRDLAAREDFAGLDLGPQLGLVPLWKDATSDLWEFWVVETGARPERDPDSGAVVVGEDTGLVLVLLPPGTFLRGAQQGDPDAPHYDPQAYSFEGPMYPVELSAFFLSKYEMTQGQWRRLTGSNPSRYTRETPSPDGVQRDASCPVESVSWLDCTSVLSRVGLSLPSEAQWERAARGGRDTVYWSGDEAASIEGAANVKDLASERAFGLRFEGERREPWDDGFGAHAPVGSFAPNPFGLHDVIGNVWEWCADGETDPRSYAPATGVDPCFACEGAPADARLRRARRGGDYSFDARWARHSFREHYDISYRSPDTGVRPARAVLR